MSNAIYFFFIAVLLQLVIACQSNTVTTPLVTGEHINITPCPAWDSLDLYSNVLLHAYTYASGKAIFGVQGVRLGTQTLEQAQRLSSKTKKGVHLHLVIDNSSDTIANDNSFEFPIADGKHQLFAFLATAYFESIKSKEAILAKEIEVKNRQLVKSQNLPYVKIVYNSPKGSFSIKETDKILLDFVLVNTKLEKDANQVRVTFDNNKVFLIDTWQAYYIEGAELGEHTVKLELLDATGKLIDTPVTKSFVVTP